MFHNFSDVYIMYPAEVPDVPGEVAAEVMDALWQHLTMRRIPPDFSRSRTWTRTRSRSRTMRRTMRRTMWRTMRRTVMLAGLNGSDEIG